MRACARNDEALFEIFLKDRFDLLNGLCIQKVLMDVRQRLALVNLNFHHSCGINMTDVGDML